MERIGEILAKSQQGLSQTWDETVAKKCSCGADFNDRVWHARNRVIENDKCPACQKKEKLEKDKLDAQKRLEELSESQKDVWLEKCGMPSYFAFKTFANYDSKLQPKAFNAVKNLQWNYDDNGNEPKSLTLLSTGIYGVGKTHLVCALLNHIAETEPKGYIHHEILVSSNKCPFLFTTENELLRRIRNTYNRSNKHNDDEFYEETEDDVYKKLSRISLLIIDDVGKVRPKDTSFTQGVYFNIIDQRYSEHMPIILTTNLDYKELEEHIGGACADRLREMCGNNFIKMAGTSYRQKAKDVSTKA